MEVTRKAIEVTGTIDDKHRLVLDEALAVTGPTRVRVIILMPDDAEVSEGEWLHAASVNPAFEFLREPHEDIYQPTDGKPFGD